jgi:lantibiotic modifying enzyme
MNQEYHLREKLKEIDRILRDQYQNSTDIGVLSGVSGIAIFQFYYARFLQDEQHEDVGAAILTSVIEEINQGYIYHTYCGGIAGAAWAIEFLKKEKFIDLDTDALLPELDDFLINSIHREEENIAFYDFLHGVLGIGYYFLKRYQSTESIVLKKKYKGVLQDIITLLDTSSLKDKGGARWESVLVKEEGLRGYNLSLSHGMSSIINFLSRLVTYDDFHASGKKLLEESVHYIMSFKSEDASCTSFFPNWVTVDDEQSKNTRLAWCYGDLGVGISLWRAGTALKDTILSENAIDVLKRSASRKDRKEAKVIDAGLCHGAYGIMHIYQYMYQETNDPVFKEAADFWIDQALDMATHEEGYAGYMQWKAGEKSGWKAEINILEGIAGIGLSIISYLAPFKTKWDECLMI